MDFRPLIVPAECLVSVLFALFAVRDSESAGKAVFVLCLSGGWIRWLRQDWFHPGAPCRRTGLPLFWDIGNDAWHAQIPAPNGARGS